MCVHDIRLKVSANIWPSSGMESILRTYYAFQRTRRKRRAAEGERLAPSSCGTFIAFPFLLWLRQIKKRGLKNAQSFGSRVENLKGACNLLLKSQDQPMNEIKNIINDAVSLRRFRDDLIHGQWKLHRKGNVLTPGIQFI